MKYPASIDPGRRSRPTRAAIRYRRAAVRLIASSVFSLGLAPLVWSGEITVQVSKRHAGNPVEAAAICLGTRANPSQFGAMLADKRGMARFDKVHARAELVLTVSKSGFKGRQVALARNGGNRGVLLTLASGGGGPECGKAAALTSQEASMMPPAGHVAPAIAIFQINGGDQTTQSTRVSLDYVLTGEASHYRASDRSDFQSAQWRPLESDLRLDLIGGSGVKTIYFQVAKLTAAEGAEIEILSNVAVDTIELDGG